jgi:hypothetical protein
MTALTQLLNIYRQESQNQREKGTYFEELSGLGIKTCVINVCDARSS